MAAHDVPPPPTASQLALLYALTNYPRILLLAYLPIEAIGLLEDARSVSILYLVSSLGVVVASAGMPLLLRRVRRRVAYAVIAATTIVALASFAVGGTTFFSAGMFLFIACSAASEILLNLYALENLDRAAQTRYEPLRIMFSIVGFVIGPTVGVLVGVWIARWLPYAMAVVIVLAGLAYLARTFVRPRPATRSALPHPFAYIKRFAAQPRLRLAYALALGRSAWWQMYFVYAPILLLQLGYPPRVAGFTTSLALAMMIFIPLWVPFARRIGVRRIEIFGFATGGLAMFAVALSADWPDFTLALLLISAFFMSSLDSVGNVFFLRAVHPFERAEMSAVFSTYRDSAQAIPPAVIAPLLRIVELPAIFGIWGAFLIGLGLLSRFLPRKL